MISFLGTILVKEASRLTWPVIFPYRLKKPGCRSLANTPVPLNLFFDFLGFD
jgi:hypothetical protein